MSVSGRRASLPTAQQLRVSPLSRIHCCLPGDVMGGRWSGVGAPSSAPRVSVPSPHVCFACCCVLCVVVVFFVLCVQGILDTVETAPELITRFFRHANYSAVECGHVVDLLFTTKHTGFDSLPTQDLRETIIGTPPLCAGFGARAGVWAPGQVAVPSTLCCVCSPPRVSNPWPVHAVGLPGSAENWPSWIEARNSIKDLELLPNTVSFIGTQPCPRAAVCFACAFGHVSAVCC